MMNIRKMMMALLLTLVGGNALADDFVETINQRQHDAGHWVVYEMNVGMFTQQGTFAAAADQLEELKKLGIDVVWLMPIYPRGTSGSPYAATNFRKTNPKYGSIADLQAFVERAHELHMQVWLDWVPNHTATNADWVTEHPEYYTKQNGQMVHPNNYGDVYQLNYGNAELAQEMTECLKFWIDEADVDGYRCDYISSNGIPASYWQQAIPEVKAHKEAATRLSKSLDDSAPQPSLTFLGETDLTDNNNSRLCNVGFDYDYAWQFQNRMANYGANGTLANPLKIYVNTLKEQSADKTFGRMLYLTNHDQNFNDGGKTLTQMYGANRYLLTVLAFTVHGMPLIYNGQETGGNQILNYFADTKINWTTTDSKMRNTLRTLCALKHGTEALKDANGQGENGALEWVTVNNNQNVLAYRRILGDSEVLVVLNFAQTETNALLTGLPAGDYTLWLDSETIGQEVSHKQVRLNATHNLHLSAKGYQVYVKGDFEEEPTAITQHPTPNTQHPSPNTQHPTPNTHHPSPTYDLLGRQVSSPNTQHPTPTITISNGRKTMNITNRK